MAGSAQSSYGEVHAGIYDGLFQDRDDLDVVAEFLASHAGNGALLEFGIGTGRVALPLAARGFRVYGVDNSRAMLDQLDAKEGGRNIVARLGSFTDTRFDDLPHPITMVFCVFTTVYLVTSQEEQIKVFTNAAHHLPIGGRFVVEAFVHDRRRFTFDQEVVTNRVTDGDVEIRAGKLDAANQTITTSRMVITPAGVSMYPNKLRFIYPSEMDLMARLAGFARRERWSDWSRGAFGPDSSNQVVVYEKVHGPA